MAPHDELYTAAVHDDDDGEEELPTSRKDAWGETRSADPIHNVTGRRGSIVTLAAECSIDSIAAVSNIVNMILAPMVIVPFLDYLTLGKIPRSNTAKPGTSDGDTAKMGSVKSISQPRTKGWTVIFVSVRHGCASRTLYTRPSTSRMITHSLALCLKFPLFCSTAGLDSHLFIL